MTSRARRPVPSRRKRVGPTLVGGLVGAVVSAGCTSSPAVPAAADGGPALSDATPRGDGPARDGKPPPKDAPSDARDAGPVCTVPDGGAVTDPVAFSQVATSCAYTCPPSPACSETKTSYVCQNLGAWGCLPHADSCNGWDGTYPEVVPGKCTATSATGDAVKYAGVDPDDATQRILPDGRRMKPAGSVWIFDESDLEGGLTTGIVAIPGTTLVVTVDDGTDQHAVRLIDTAKIGSGQTPVLSYVVYASPSTLNSGIAFRAPDLVLVTTDNGNIQALTYDPVAKTIVNDDSRSLPLTLTPSMPSSGSSDTYYASGIAVSGDGTKAVVTAVNDDRLLVFDVKAGSPTYGSLLGQVSLGSAETFGVAFDPLDTAGTTAYVSMWGDAQVIAVDVSTPASPTVKHTYATGKDPEGVAFLDTRWMLVADDLGDSLSIVDRVGGTVTAVSTEQSDHLPGVEPIGLSYDAARKRLYVPYAAANAVGAYDVDTTKSPPSLVPAGRLPTSWWPSGVVTLADGTVVVASMQGNGSGPAPMYFDIAHGEIGDLMRGGIQTIPAPSASDLTAGDALVAKLNDVGGVTGAPEVTCPPGAADFPLPESNAVGPSPRIKHVFLIIRENKSFDGVFGDLKNVNGDPAYTLKQKPGEMDEIWGNLRALGQTFAIADNFYTDAVYSTQGHMWDTYGRSCDFDERTWAMAGDGRNARAIPGAGVQPAGMPVEGSLFDWLGSNGVEYDILGEIVGIPATKNQPVNHPPIDFSYPGGAYQSIFYDDDEKGCHIAGRARVTCDFASFVYATLPNDHTQGVEAKTPAPETYCAVNDDATGMTIDGISHSPLWESSLILITEDDPSQGGEHIDSHRTPLVIISPWVKRGYVTTTHFDVPSLHKMFAHIFGKPYPNTLVAHAALPLDLFTSTPDYTPYTYIPRTYPLVCGGKGTQAEQRLTRSWDFDDVDEQPGLDQQVMRWMRDEQLETLDPRLERQVEARWDQKVRPRRAKIASEAPAVAGAERHLRPDDDDDDD